MKRHNIAIFVLGAPVPGTAVYIASAATVRHLGAVVSLFYDNGIIRNALAQLVYAQIKPPLWLPLICSFAVFTFLFFAFTQKKRPVASVFIKTAAVLGSVLITVLSYAGTVWFTYANGVPVHTAAGIITSMIGSGVLG